MKLIFFMLIVLLITQIGFWNTLAAVLGAIVMVPLLAIVALAVLIVGGFMVAAAFR